MNIWLSRKDAIRKISVSVDTVERRAVPWQEQRVPQQIRFKLLKLAEDTRQERRYFEPDVEALLEA
jgi:hypothetical protein